LCIAEAVGLEVGETPPCIAEALARRSGGVIFGNRRCLLAESLHGVRDREMQLGGVYRTRQQRPVELDGTFVLPEADAGHGVQRAVIPVGTIHCEQLLGLRLCLEVQVTSAERLRVLETRSVVI